MIGFSTRQVRSVGSVAALILVVWACEHPLGIVTPHIEAADLELSTSDGTLLARTEFNRSWNVGALEMQDGVPLELVLTPIDFQGQPIDVSERADISFRLEAEEGSLLQWEPLTHHSVLRPFGAGETQVRFLIWHNTHADFITPWLRVVIRPAG